MATLTASPAPIDTTAFPISVRGEWASRMTEEEFWTFCQDNPHLRIKRDADHTILLMPPTGPLSIFRSGESFRQLSTWALDRPGLVCDSSGGFTLPDKSVLSPDASWISPERLATVPDAELLRFAHLCPDFIIEVISPSDSVPASHRKMAAWLTNGVRLGFLIAPASETAWVYHLGAEPTEVNGFDHTLSGEEVLPGFVLELRRLRR